MQTGGECLHTAYFKASFDLLSLCEKVNVYHNQQEQVLLFVEVFFVHFLFTDYLASLF